jgi:arylsulfatase A-like enzyme
VECFHSPGAYDRRDIELLKSGQFRRVLVVLAFAALAGSLTLWSGSAAAHHGPRRSPIPHRVPTSLAPRRPNIVFVLTDDLSMDLLRFMPHVQEMERQGLSFQDYFVSDSLCCPSRASIFTGNFPHDTGIYSNTGTHGGFDEFFARAEEQRTFAVALRRAGYRTALMGKYLNGYLMKKGMPAALPPTYVPPGWSAWDGVGWGYPEFNYLLNQNGVLHAYGHRPSDYLTDVLARDGLAFINSSVSSGQPFFLELATFAPHSPYRPAPRNAHDFPGLHAPEPPSYNTLPINPPRWLAGRPPLSPAAITRINNVFRLRAQSVEAIDDMIGEIQAELRADGQAQNTYIVFSSDNGLHTGEYRLMPGKMTAFDTDIRVPLVIDGPGIPPGATTSAMAENIDLAETFADIGGSSLSGDGHSLVPLFGGQTPPGWRDAILVEHRGPDVRVSDPDFQQPSSGNPPSYEAMRSHDFLYVEYRNGDRELYNLRQDPFELDNLAPSLSPQQLAQLHADLVAMEQCHGAASCWGAMHLDRATNPLVRHRG